MTKGNYQVLARKWRPQRFADVVGQQAIVRALANALDQGRIAHAYCFSGIRGVGKTTIARLVAKGLNCRAVDAPTSAPCGHCESCAEVVASRSMDVFERDAASDRGINEMKELIEIARYAPSRDRYKVMILDEAHMLTPEASNALLKLLEEPPGYIVFVLATTEPNRILPTILSRCQHYQFRRVSQREITAHLNKIAAAEGVTISADALALVAAAADGSLRDGQSLLDKLIAFAGAEIAEDTVVELLGLVDRLLLFRATELIADRDLPGVLGFVNEMVENGVDLHQFAIDLLGHVRNLLVVHTVSDPGDILHLPDDDIARLRQQAEGFGVEDLDRAFSLIAANEYRIKAAEQPRYHLEVVLSRLARMPHLQPIEELIGALRGQSGSGGPAPQGGGGGKARPTQQPAPTRASALAAPTASGEPSRLDDDPGPAPEPVEESVPAATAVPPAPEADPMTAEPAGGSSLLRRIQDRVSDANPLIAQVLGRASGISLAGQTIVFKFPASAGIFADRVRDPEVLRMLSAGAQRELGRSVVARVETEPNGSAPMADVASPARDDDSPAAPSPMRSAAQREPASSQSPAAPANGSAAVTPLPPDPELRARAESDAQVKEFLRVLKGQITSIEEPAKR